MKINSNIFLKIRDNFSKSILLFGGLAFFLIRILLEVVTFFSNKYDGIYFNLITFVISIIISFSFSLFIFQRFQIYTKKLPDFYTIFKTQTKYLIFLNLINFLIILFSKKEIVNNTKPSNFLVDLSYLFFTIVFLTILLLNILSIIYWLNSRKFSKKLWVRKLWFWIFDLFVILSFIYNYLLTNLKEGEFPNIDFSLSFFPFLKFSILFILCYIAFDGNNWIIRLNKGQKAKLNWALLFTIILSSLLFYRVEIPNSIYSKILNYYILFGSEIANLVYFIIISISIRLLWTTLLSLPSTEIITRKILELNHLADLNRIVINNSDINQVTSEITKIAMNSLNGSAAWIEFINDENITVSQSAGISHQLIKQIIDYRLLSQEIYKKNEGLIIESLEQEVNLSYIKKYFPQASSLVASPINQNENRIGTLIVLHPDEFGFEIDDLNLLNAFSNNLNIALENYRLVTDSIENEKYKRDLFIAREIQKKLLPQCLPKMGRLQICAFSEPAEEVGGDFYDFLTLKNGDLCILIGDVSGKGISTAFYMAQVKGIAMSASIESESPIDLLKKINSALYGNLEKKTYVTISALSFNTDSKISFHSRAGHMPLYTTLNDKITKHQPSGIGIGMLSPEKFNEMISQEEIPLISGTNFFLFTDGVNELRNSENDEYGFDLLQDFLLNNNEISSDDQIEALKINLFEFAANAKQHDDISMIAIKFE